MGTSWNSTSIPTSLGDLTRGTRIAHGAQSTAARARKGTTFPTGDSHLKAL